MAKIIDEKLVKGVDWENYSGKRVQEFIKEELETLESDLTSKVGYIQKNESEGKIYFSASEEDYKNNKFISSIDVTTPYALVLKAESNEKIFLTSSEEKNFTWYFKTIYTSNKDLINPENITVDYKITNNNKEKLYSTNISVLPDETNDNFTAVKMDLNQYLTEGNSKIDISITGLRTRLEGSLSFNVSIVKLDVTDKTEFKRPFVNSFVGRCEVKCTNSQTAVCLYRLDEDGDFKHHSSITESGTYNIEVDINSLSDGKHIFEYKWCLTIGAVSYYTETQRIEFIKNKSSNFELLIFNKYGNNVLVKDEFGNLIINNVYQYLPNTTKYSIYNPNNVTTTMIDFYKNDVVVARNTIENGETGELKLQFTETGMTKVVISAVYTDNNGETKTYEREVYFNVIESDLGIMPYTQGMRINFSSIGKSNNSDVDKTEWVSTVKNNKATFNEEFDWSQGWTEKGLVINDKCELIFDYTPFPIHKENATGEEELEFIGGTNSYTFEIEFMTQNVTNEDAIVCDMKNETDDSFCGFQITGSEFRFFLPNSKGETPDVSTRFKSNELNRIVLVINPNGDKDNFKGLVELYVNGILSSISKYSYDDKFIVKDNLGKSKPLTFKPENGADIVVKEVIAYNGKLNDDNIVDNYILSRTDSLEMENLFTKNMVLRDGIITPQAILDLGNIPVLVFVGRTNNDEIATGDGNEGDGKGNLLPGEEYKRGNTQSANEENWYQTLENTTDKKKNIDMDVIYYNPLDKSKNFKLIKAYITPQGTSSMYYPKKNYRIYTQKNTDTRCFFSDMSKNGAGVLEFEDMMTWHFGEDIENKSGANERKWEKWRGVKNYKKRKYSFKDNSQPVKCWCLKADFAETSSSHNTGIARLWGDTMKTAQIPIGGDPIQVLKTRAQKVTEDIYVDNSKNMPDVRTTIDGFPIVVFGKRSYNGRIVDGIRVEDPYVFLGQYNFNNDKSTESVFGFCDINNDERSEIEYTCENYDTNERTSSVFTLDNMLDKYMTCVETLDNGNTLANFKTMTQTDSSGNTMSWDDVWDKAFEFRYPEIPEPPKPKDYEKGEQDEDYISDYIEYEEDLRKWKNMHLKPFKHFAEWVYSTKWCDVNGMKLSDITDEEAERRKEKFAKEKWLHLDVWKVAAYYVYVMRFGAVDQIVKNSMLTSEGPFAHNINGAEFDTNINACWDSTDITSENYGKYLKWYFINYDNDTIMGVKNDGSLAYGPNILRTSVDRDGTYIYAGSESTLWNNLDADDEFKTKILPLVDQGISKTLTYNKAITMFDVEQVGKWCERIYNKDAEYKYVGPYLSDWKYSGTTTENFSDKLFMLQGSRTAHRRWWLSRRFNLFDGKWTSGEFPNKYIEIKCNYGEQGDKFSAAVGSNGYFGYKINNINYPGAYGEVYEYKANDIANWELFKNIQIGDPIAIYGAIDITELNLMGISKNLTSLAFYFGNQTDIENKLEKLIISIPDDLLKQKASYESFSDELSGDTVVAYAIDKLCEKYEEVSEKDFNSGKYLTYNDGEVPEVITDDFYRVVFKDDETDEIITYVYFARVENGVRNYSCKELSLNALNNLKVLKVAGYQGLSSLNLEKSKYIEEVDASYSTVRSMSFGAGSTINKLTASDSLRTLYFESCGNITLNNIMIDDKMLKDNGGYNITNITVKDSNGLNHDDNFKDFIISWMNYCIKNNKSIGRTLILNGINWSNVSINELQTILNFYNGEGNNKPQTCTLSGEIYLMKNINITTREYEVIETFKKTFGVNVVITSPIVLIDDINDIVAGQEIMLNSTVFASDDTATYNVTYNFVIEDNNGDFEDVSLGKRYSIVDGSVLRKGLSLSVDGRTVKCTELILSADTKVMIGAFIKADGIDKFDITSFTIKDPTYAIENNSYINGQVSLNDTNKRYEYKVLLGTNQNEEPLGTVNIDWEITSSDNGLEFITSSVSFDKKTLYITTNNNLPDVEQKTADLKISAKIDNSNSDFKDFILEKDILILNETILLTKVSNPVVMKICSDNGWASDEIALTKEEALAITSEKMGKAFANINEEEWSFDEFEFFTSATTLSDEAFANSKLTSIKLPESITSLGSGIFKNCTNLKDIILPQGINKISKEMFLNCESLNSIKIPDNVRTIEENSFGNVGIKKILIDEENGSKSLLLTSDSKLNTIHNNAFEKDAWTHDSAATVHSTNVLEVASLPKTLEIGVNSFKFLLSKNLKEITTESGSGLMIEDNILYANRDKSVIIRCIPNVDENEIIKDLSLSNINLVRDYAFYNCNSIKNITFNNLDAYSLGEGVFYNSEIETIDLSECSKLMSLKDYTFGNCGKLTEVKLPNDNGSLRELGFRLFDGCINLSEITLPNTIEHCISYGNGNFGYQFNNCGITSLTIPNNLLQLPFYFVSNCSNLEELKFSKYFNLSYSNNHQLFVDCAKLTTIYLPLFSRAVGANEYYIYKDNKILYGPCTENEALIVINKLQIDNRPTSLQGVVYTYSSLTSSNLVINNSFYSKGSNETFIRCGSIEKFVLHEDDNNLIMETRDGGKSIIRVGNGNMTNNTITPCEPKLVKVVYSATDYTLPDNIEEIETGAFANCGNLSNVKLNDGLITIGSYAFNETNNLTTLTLPKTLVIINSHAFKSSSVIELIIPESVTNIGTYAFGECKNLKKLIIKANIDSIPTQFCYSSRVLEEVEIWSENIKSIEMQAFTQCYVLRSILINVLDAPKISNKGDVHPFKNVGTNYKGIKKLLLPYNHNGYDSSEWITPLIDTYEFEIENITLENDIAVVDENLNNMDMVYVKRETNDNVETIPVLSPYNEGDTKRFIMLNSEKIYHGEIIVVYSDEECNNEIGRFVAKYGTDSYNLTKDIVMGSTYSKSLFNTNIFDDEKVVENSDTNEMANITKHEYNLLLAKVNQLMKLLNKKK